MTIGWDQIHIFFFRTAQLDPGDKKDTFDRFQYQRIHLKEFLLDRFYSVLFSGSESVSVSVSESDSGSS